MGCHFLLQGIFQTQISNLRLLCLLHWQADSGKPPSSAEQDESLIQLPISGHMARDWGSSGEANSGWPQAQGLCRTRGYRVRCRGGTLYSQLDPRMLTSFPQWGDLSRMRAGWEAPVPRPLQGKEAMEAGVGVGGHCSVARGLLTRGSLLMPGTGNPGMKGLQQGNTSQ